MCCKRMQKPIVYAIFHQIRLKLHIYLLFRLPYLNQRQIFNWPSFNKNSVIAIFGSSRVFFEPPKLIFAFVSFTILPLILPILTALHPFLEVLVFPRYHSLQYSNILVSHVTKFPYTRLSSNTVIHPAKHTSLFTTVNNVCTVYTYIFVE